MIYCYFCNMEITSKNYDRYNCVFCEQKYCVDLIQTRINKPDLRKNHTSRSEVYIFISNYKLNYSAYYEIENSLLRMYDKECNIIFNGEVKLKSKYDLFDKIKQF